MCMAPLPQAKLEQRKHRMSESEGEVGWEGEGKRKQAETDQQNTDVKSPLARSKRYVSAASFGERVVESDRSWIVKEFEYKQVWLSSI